MRHLLHSTLLITFALSGCIVDPASIVGDPDEQRVDDGEEEVEADADAESEDVADSPAAPAVPSGVVFVPVTPGEGDPEPDLPAEEMPPMAEPPPEPVNGAGLGLSPETEDEDDSADEAADEGDSAVEDEGGPNDEADFEEEPQAEEPALEAEEEDPAPNEEGFEGLEPEPEIVPESEGEEGADESGENGNSAPSCGPDFSPAEARCDQAGDECLFEQALCVCEDNGFDLFWTCPE